MNEPTLEVVWFLASRRIAVVGVSRQSNQPANAIYRKLRDSGHEVFAVNPRAHSVEGARCYSDLASIPGGVEAVVVVTPPDASAGVVREAADLGVRHIWLHRAVGEGSVSDEAVEAGCERGLEVIVGGCPLMFVEPVDLAHRCLRWWLVRTGKLDGVVSITEDVDAA